jgi:glycosyltransferase involved in cell wall biosynthesis
MTISVVIPIHNEAASLTTLLGELDHVSRALPQDMEFLFVDDGSTDESWKTIRALCEAESRARGIRFRRNFGKAAALTAGFQAAKGTVVFTLDGDLQDDPAEIPRFLTKIEGDFDVVSGWKKRRHDPWHKVGPSRIFNWLVSAISGCKLHDHNCGFKAYRAEVLREVGIYGELHRFVPVLAFARGFRVGEIEVNHRPRKHGRSHYGFSRFIKGLLDLVTVQFLSRFSQRPLHVIGGIGLALFGLGGLGLFYLAILWFFERIGERPLLAYSAALVGVGTQLICLGILGELITRYNIKAEDTYSIAETTAPVPPGPASSVTPAQGENEP